MATLRLSSHGDIEKIHKQLRFRNSQRYLQGQGQIEIPTDADDGNRESQRLLNRHHHFKCLKLVIAQPLTQKHEEAIALGQ